MRLGKPVARSAVNAISAFSRSNAAQIFPLSLASRVLTNRATPWLAHSAYAPGTQTVNGVRMEIPEPPKWGGGGEFHMALGTYEVAEMEFMLGRLKPGQTFLDVGAHIGYFALPAAKRVGQQGRVIAVEPSPASIELLKRNIRLNQFDCVSVIEGAASDVDGTATLTVSSQSAMWNTLRGETLGGSDHTNITVRTRSIDSILAEAGWPQVAGMKLDVEGAESAVLQGATEALRRNPRAFVMFEVSGGTAERVAASMQTLRWFEARGFAFRPLGLRYGESALVPASALAPRLQRSQWYEHLFNVSAELAH